jgi:L-cysteine S-thiosulfotransferase
VIRLHLALIAVLAPVLGTFLAASPALAQDDRLSGRAFMSPGTQAMQDDDTANPGLLSVLEGDQLWSAPAGTTGRSCGDCHGPMPGAMAGVAARYPAFDPTTGGAIDLAGRIDRCRTENQGAAPLRREGRELIALTTAVAHRARGMPVMVGDDPRLAPVIAEGQRLYETRMGQLNFSCADCHDRNWGQRLGASPIPQAHPTGYPIYRLEWQDAGSLQRRLRGCMTGVRAEPFAYGSPEFTALEAFLMDRARGMPMETPGVRP